MMKLTDTHLLILILGLGLFIIYLTYVFHQSPVENFTDDQDIQREQEKQSVVPSDSILSGTRPTNIDRATTSPNSSPSDLASHPPQANQTHLLVELPKKVSCLNDSDCNQVYGQGENKCVQGKCNCKKGTGTYCHRCPNYYKDPKDMTPAQIIKFKNKAKLENMTLDDYKNWLSLFQYDLESLPSGHHQNLKRLLEGKPIYGIPITSDIEDFIADKAQKIQTSMVTLNIPNTEIDSPLNYDPVSTLNSTGEIDKLGRTAQPLEWGGYAGYGQFRNSPRARLKRIRNMRADEWFQRGNFPWIFNESRSGHLYKENRFQNIINKNNEGRRACCRAKIEQQKFLKERRPNVFDVELKSDERVFGPRPNKIPGDLYRYPASETGLGIGSTREGATIRAEQNRPIGSGPQPHTNCDIAGAGNSPLANF